MAGLIEKDIRLLLMRKSAIVIFLAIAVFMAVTQNGSFAVAYTSILCVIFSISSISYDDADNGYPFLFSLPITIKEYVTEKFLFSIVAGIIGWAFSGIVYIVAGIVKNAPVNLSEEGVGMLSFIPLVILMASVMIALQLKFGAENSRIVMLILGGVIFVVAFIMGKFGILEKVVNVLDKTSSVLLICIGIVLTIAIAVGSYFWSISIMRKKLS